MDLVVAPDDRAAAATGAELLAGWLTAAVDARGAATVAVSGGRTPWLLFANLAERDLPWDAITVFQVDERLAPDGSDERNLTHLAAALAAAPVRIVPMAAATADPDVAADRYGAGLPERFDVVHLGLGPDGHTASLVPGDPVCDVTDRPVALTAAPYQGCRRMTLTAPVLTAARRQLWVVTGDAKRPVLPRLLAADPQIPAGRVVTAEAIVVADTAAAGPDGVPGGSPAREDG